MDDSMKDIMIRKMAASDLEEVRTIYRVGWQSAFRGIVPQDYLDHMDLSDWAPPLEGAFVLSDGKRCLGTSSVSSARDERLQGWGEIISIFILPELIGKGYGKMLFEYVKKDLITSGFQKIYLNVFEDNHRARAFYEKRGFTWEGEKLPLVINGEELTELRYCYRQPEAGKVDK